MDKAELQYTIDKVADISCFLMGYKTAVNSNPHGNQAARKANLELAQYIEARLRYINEFLEDLRGEKGN